MSNKPLYIQALEALRNRQMLFRIFIFTLVTVVFWIGFSIFFSQQKTKVAVDVQKHTIPLNPNINKETLSELATRKTFSDQELQDFPIYDRVVSEEKQSTLIIAGSQPQSDTPAATLDFTEEISTNSAETTEDSSPSATPDLLPETTQEATGEGSL